MLFWCVPDRLPRPNQRSRVLLKLVPEARSSCTHVARRAPHQIGVSAPCSPWTLPHIPLRSHKTTSLWNMVEVCIEITKSVNTYINPYWYVFIPRDQFRSHKITSLLNIVEVCVDITTSIHTYIKSYWYVRKKKKK